MTTVSTRPANAPVSAFVHETFMSFQGEGPLAGQRCAFVRFSHCNLACSWCDTEESWNFTRYDRETVSTRVRVSELTAWVVDQDVGLLVITGGEPLLQQRALLALAGSVPESVRVQVETNGTIAPAGELARRVDLWVVSPKLENSRIAHRKRIKPGALAALAATGRAVFKFVVADAAHDLDEIADLAAEHGLAPIWVMPEGETPEAVLAGMRALAEPAVRRGWNISPRLHILAGAR